MGTPFLSYLSITVCIYHSIIYVFTFILSSISDTLIHVHHLSSVYHLSNMILRYVGVGFKFSELDKSQYGNTG